MGKYRLGQNHLVIGEQVCVKDDDRDWYYTYRQILKGKLHYRLMYEYVDSKTKRK